MSSSEPVTWMDLQLEFIGTPSTVGEPPTALSGNAILAPLRRVQTLPGTGSIDSRLTMRPQLQWTAGLKTAEVGSAVKAVPWPTEEASLRAEMLQLETRTAAEFQRLSQAMEALRRTVEASSAASYAPDPVAPITAWGRVTVDDVKGAAEAGLLTALFNYIADEEISCSQEVGAEARSALQSKDDDNLRAAAGRALSVLDPARALDALDEAIVAEENPVVASILRSARRSIAA